MCSRIWSNSRCGFKPWLYYTQGMRREFDTTDRLLCGFDFDTPHWTLMLNNPPIRKDGAPSTEEQRKAGRGKFSRCMSKSVTGASHQINMCLFSKLTHSVFYFFSWVLDGYRDHWLPLQGCFTKSLISKHVHIYTGRKRAVLRCLVESDSVWSHGL